MPTNPPRIVVTSDLHFDPDGDLTLPTAIAELVEQIEAERPDAVVLAGDLAHGLGNFRACLELFRRMAAPVAVLAGNHDVWRDPDGTSSRELWEGALRRECDRVGFVWLEDAVVRLGPVAIAGSMAWYDYSAASPGAGVRADDYAALKARISNDAHWIDWPWTDRELAATLLAGLEARLQALAEDATVERVVVVTHVPIFEEQMVRKPGNGASEIGNAYFGNLTVGERVARQPKVSDVVSGHTHVGRRARRERPGMTTLELRVVDSDYGRPAYEVVTVDGGLTDTRARRSG